MGRDKSMLPWGESTLLDHAVANARRAVTDVIVVVAEHADAPPSGARIVVDDPVDVGPIGALHGGLRAARHDRCVTCPCDAPFVTADLLQELLVRLDGHSIVAPVSSHGVEPLCAAWNTNITPHVKRHIADGGRSLRGLIECLPDVLLIPIDELESLADTSDPFANLNTPDEYRRAHAQRHPSTRQEQR
jgi:molybdopterin-guanine dinucleotide biosynthesis protein A